MLIDLRNCRRVALVALLAVGFTQGIGPVGTASAVTTTYTGTLDAADPTMPVVAISPPNCTTQLVTPVHYEVIPVPIASAGTYLFSLTSATADTSVANFASMYLYEGSFDPTDGLTNCVAGDNSGNPKEITYDPLPGTPYFVVVFDDQFSQPGGTYELVVTTPDADLSALVAVGGGPHEPGDPVPISVSVSNAGPADALEPTVIITLPTQFAAGSITNLVASGPGSDDYDCDPDLTGRVLTCTVARHPVGVPATITFDATLATAGSQPILVRAEVVSAADPVTANNTSTTAVVPPTFVSITPTRVVDTRAALGVLTESVAAGATIKIPITTLDAIPDEATSVVVNLTSTRIQDAGFLTLYACTSPRPDTSNSNYRPGADTANLTISTIGTDGSVCLYTSAVTDVIVDVMAYTTTGFTPTTPQRLADTRTGAAPAAGSTIQVPLPAGATHVVNVTSTRSTDAGFLTVHDCDLPRPDTSNLNYAAGVDIANLTIASADGVLCVYTSSPTDIIVDHLGTVAAATGALERLVDTRTGAAATPGTVIPIPTIATSNPTAAINLTATRTTSAGFLTVHECSQPVPNTSNLNVSPGRDIANLAIIPTAVAMCVTVNADTDVIIDLQTTIA